MHVKKSVMKNIKNVWERTKQTIRNQDGMSVVELILVLVGILTPYYGVSIKCIT